MLNAVQRSPEKDTSSVPQQKINEYVVFMRWFHTSYPELYTRAWYCCTVSSDERPFVIVKEELDTQTYEKLVGVEKEYRSDLDNS